MDFSRLFPRAGLAYDGPRLPFYFLIVLTAASTVRSLIHIAAPDGGAHTIAGINVAVPGGSDIIAMFGQWGASQLVLALIYWLVIWRYRFLVPAMLAVVVLEQILRLAVGQLKPLHVVNPPPGAFASQIILPLAIAALLWSLKRGHPAAGRASPRSVDSQDTASE
jgi:hypothetical protein